MEWSGVGRNGRGEGDSRGDEIVLYRICREREMLRVG